MFLFATFRPKCQVCRQSGFIIQLANYAPIGIICSDFNNLMAFLSVKCLGKTPTAIKPLRISKSSISSLHPTVSCCVINIAAFVVLVLFLLNSLKPCIVGCWLLFCPQTSVGQVSRVDVSSKVEVVWADNSMTIVLPQVKAFLDKTTTSLTLEVRNLSHLDLHLELNSS